MLKNIIQINRIEKTKTKFHYFHLVLASYQLGLPIDRIRSQSFWIMRDEQQFVHTFIIILTFSTYKIWFFLFVYLVFRAAGSACSFSLSIVIYNIEIEQENEQHRKTHTYLKRNHWILYEFSLVSDFISLFPN